VIRVRQRGKQQRPQSKEKSLKMQVKTEKNKEAQI